MGDGFGKVKHLVVLMMENRSFDHMLGYLAIDGLPGGVDGLDPSRHGNRRAQDAEFERVRPMAGRHLHHKVQDPGHLVPDVVEQLGNGMGGFLANYVKVLGGNRATWDVKKGGPLPPDDDLWDDVVLGYQEAEDVPVYDYIARNFVVCDRWFSSVAGPTWPNRMYAMTGGLAPKATIPKWIPERLRGRLRGVPLYDGEAFPRWLQPDIWRWYSHDPATLRAADAAFRPGGEHNVYSTDANFAYFNRRTLFEDTTFLDDAARGKLPAVSWIDPNFVDLRPFGPPGSNDDHPPSRVLLGQELVLTILLALARSPCWDNCALLIVYDEHGGFYDHVDPSDYACAGDASSGYGVRVPALFVSPYAKPNVSHTVFDHTSIPKTILSWFAGEDAREEAFEHMGPRTRAANDLGDLLSLDEPRDPPVNELETLKRDFAQRKAQLYRKGYEEASTLTEDAYDLITDLQVEVVVQAAAMRGADLPPGKP
jgi:phospholipase C